MTVVLLIIYTALPISYSLDWLDSLHSSVISLFSPISALSRGRRSSNSKLEPNSLVINVLNVCIVSIYDIWIPEVKYVSNLSVIVYPVAINLSCYEYNYRNFILFS